MEKNILIAGATLLVLGVFLFSYSGMQLDEYGDASGIIDRALSEDARQAYDNWKLLRAVSTAGMALGALLAVIGLLPAEWRRPGS